MILRKTLYELWKDRKSSISYFYVFGCWCLILNNGKNNFKKFDVKSDEGIFLQYSTSSKTYRVLNKRTLVVQESIHIVFDESNDKPSRKEDMLNDDAENLNKKIDDLTLKDDSPQNDEED